MPAEEPVPAAEHAPVESPAPPPASAPPADPEVQPRSQTASEPQPAADLERLAPTAPTPAAPGQLDAAAVRSMWSTVRDKVRERSRTIDVMLAGAIVRAVDGDTLVLAHQSAPLAKRLCEQRNTDVVRDALKDALGVNWRLRCEAGAGEPMPVAEPLPPEPQPDPAATQRAEEDDMIAEARDDETQGAPPRDPEEVALELLQNELGARRIDG